MDARERRGGPLISHTTDEATVVGEGPSWALRESPYPFWQSLRERLHAQGIDAQTTLLVVSFEEGPTERGKFDVDEVGILVTRDESVIEFRYSYKQESWLEWTDLTERWRDSEYASVIAPALAQQRDIANPS